MSETYSGGQGKSGVDLGPNALVERGLLSQLSELGWNVHYEGPAEFDDIPYINPNQPGASNGREVLPDPDMEIIRDHAMEGRLPLTLGGDHSLVSGPYKLVEPEYRH
jgi:arginase